MTRIALYPGSFDPPTLGHQDLVRRSVPLADRVVVAVAANSAKQPLFSVAERLAMLRATVGEDPRISFDAFEGLLADYARRIGASLVVRGLRAVAAELARAEPAEGEWQAAYQSVQESARSALRRFRPPGGSPADPFPAAPGMVVWRCPDCGGVDAPQPCLGVCIWRAAQWVDVATYKAERARALADRQAERSLAGLLRALAFTTPRPGQWERNWRALQARAQQALTR